jgi:microcin C transport system substrate-binding protein
MKSFKKYYFTAIFLLSVFYVFNFAYAQPLECEKGFKCSSSITIFEGEPKYKTGFKNFDYVNPNAPKGGELKLGVMGTFDSLNPFIIKGVSAAGAGSIYETLLEGSSDEIFSRYGLLADKIKISDDKFKVRFVLRPEAKWHDGIKITADDVVWSFNTLMQFGSPSFQNYYKDVKEVRKISDAEVEFEFKVNNNRELPIIVGEFSILPKHYWEKQIAAGKKFDETTLQPPLGSGAYKFDKIDVGKTVSYTRVADYWGKDLPVNVGRANFDKITYDYYRDETVLVEAFKAGQFDLRQENVAKNWANSYNIDAVKNGKIIKEEIQHEIPTGMQAFLPNLRREKFADVNVRKALTLAFDFEWANKNLFFNSYTRTKSYFQNSIYASSGKISVAERKLLEPFKDKLPSEIFDAEFTLPVTDASGQPKENLLKAKDLLEKAGWKIAQGGKLKNAKGEEFKIEFMINSPAMQRVVIPYTKNLERLGITSSIRMVDPSQYEQRVQTYDFDIIVHVFGSGLVPGNELTAYWNSKGADAKGGANLAGVKNEVVDGLVDIIINAKTKDELITACKALDRVLLWNYYMIPQFSLGKFRVLNWDKFGKPQTRPTYDLGTDTWWVKPAK